MPLMRPRISATSFSQCLAQLGVAEHGRHQLGTMRRRVRVVRTDADLHLALHGVGAALSLATTVSAPTRSQYRPKFFENELQTISSAPGRAERPQADGVFVDAVGEALVGEVQERQKPLLVDRRRPASSTAPASGRCRSGCGSSRGA